MELKNTIERAWEDRSLLTEPNTQEAINTVIDQLDKGLYRVAEPKSDGRWQVNEWIKKAVVMYFPIRKMVTMEVGPFEFHDKMERGHEIQAILDQYYQITNYVILDDDDDMLLSQRGNFVRTSNNINHPDCIDIGYGLTKECTNRAIRILNK